MEANDILVASALSLRFPDGIDLRLLDFSVLTLSDYC